jgi:hypothetical protein
MISLLGFIVIMAVLPVTVESSQPVPLMNPEKSLAWLLWEIRCQLEVLFFWAIDQQISFCGRGGIGRASEQELADVIHVAAALRAGGAITHGTHLLDG